MLLRSKIHDHLHFNYLSCEEPEETKDNSKSLKRRYKILNFLQEN